MLNLQDVERDLDNMRRVQIELDKIISEASPLGVFLVDENGFLVAEAGDIELDRVALSALVAASFGATAEIARIMGEADFNRLTHQGVDKHLFLGKAGDHHILIVIFGKDTNLGLIKLYAEKVATLIGEILHYDDTEPKPSSNDAPSEPADSSGLFPAWLSEKE